MKKQILEESRKIIGKYLADIAKEKKLSTYEVAKQGNIKWDIVKALFEGKGSTVDTLLTVVSVLNQYIYFAEKEKKTEPYDFEDLIEKGIGKHPEN
jgi:predicted transcriptional regulator